MFSPLAFPGKKSEGETIHLHLGRDFCPNPLQRVSWFLQRPAATLPTPFHKSVSKFRLGRETLPRALAPPPPPPPPPQEGDCTSPCNAAESRPGERAILQRRAMQLCKQERCNSAKERCAQAWQHCGPAGTCEGARGPRHLVAGWAGRAGSVSQQFEAREPADQQGRLCGRGLGPGGHAFLLGAFVRERDGGAAVQISVDIAAAPSDVVGASHQLPLGWGPGEAVRGRGALLQDGGDPLVAEVPAQEIVPFPPVTSRSSKGIHNPHPAPISRHGQRPGFTIRWGFFSHFCGHNIRFHGVSGQLIGISNSESPSAALLVQEGIWRLRPLPAEQGLFTPTGSATSRTPFLIARGVGHGWRRRNVQV